MTPPAMPDLLRRAADDGPTRTAIEVVDGPRLSYGDWQRRSDALAAGLLARGVQPGDRVLLRFDRRRWADHAVAFLAVQRAAGVAVPTAAHLTGREVARILREQQPAVAVAPADLAPAVDRAGPVDPAVLEREGRGRARRAWPRGTGPVGIVHRSRPLTRPVAQVRSLADLAGGPLASFGPLAGATAWVHAFPVGSAAALDVLYACLAHALRCTVLPSFDPDRCCALLAAAAGPVVLGLHPAAAEALLASGAAGRHDLTGVTGLVLAPGPARAGSLVDLAEAFPEAEVLVLDEPASDPADGDRAPQRDRDALPVGDAAPPSSEAVVEIVTAVWRRVLVRDELRPDEDLLGLGADGLAVHTARSLIEDATGVRLPVDAVLAAPTVAGVAAAVQALQPPRDAPVPVAFSQEGMLWYERFSPGSQNLPGLARRLRGPLDVGALRRALDTIVRRHAPLRTTFELRDGRLVQVVAPHRDLDLPVRDLGGLAPDEREAEVQRAVTDAGRRPFDLVTDPLFEPMLLRLAEDDHVLVIRTHHSVFDDWSVGVFRRELAALYTASTAGEASPLDDLPTSFVEAVREQRRRLAGPAGAREMDFWRRELDGAPLTTQLPVDDPDRPTGSPQPSAAPVTVQVPDELREGLRALARRRRATVFMVLLTAFGALVRRYTGQRDLLLATVVANRNRTELEGLIGCLTKKVPLRLPLADDPPFTDALAATRQALLGALRHQDLPFETVVQGVLGAEAAAHGVVPHLAVVVQGVTPEEELDLPGLDTAGFETSTRAQRTHFMGDDDPDRGPAGAPWGGGLYQGPFVIVSVDPTGDGLSVIARGAFHRPAMRDLLDRYRTLLADVVAHPERRLSAMEVLDRPAAEEVLARTSGPAVPVPEPMTVHARGDRDGRGRIAVRAGDATLTRIDLTARVDELADRLRELGIGPGDRVGIRLPASVDAVVAALATWRVQAAWVGLDAADAAGAPRAVAADLALAAVVEGTPATVRGVQPGGPPGRSAEGPTDAVVLAADHAAPVALGRRAIANLRLGLRRRVYRPPGQRRPGRVCLSASPTDPAFLRQLVALLDDHPLEVPDAHLGHDPARVLALLAQGRIDVLDVDAHGLEVLLGGGLADALEDRDPGGAPPVLVVGTEGPLRPELWAALRSLARLRASLVYGPPACAAAATARPVAGGAARPHVGRALPNVTVRVLDQGGRPVPVRAVGELHLGGASLARPSDRPRGDTADAWVEAAAEDGGRLLRTGQLAQVLPDGAVELLGPVDADRDLRGFRVDPDRIARALAEHPGVREAAARLERDATGRPRLVARIVTDGPPPSAPALRAFQWSRLPGYAWPSAIVPTAGPAVVGHSPDGTSRGPAADVVAAAWTQALGVEAIPPDANYWQAFPFLEALARAREAGVPVADAQVSRNRTIATLAADLAAGPGP